MNLQAGLCAAAASGPCGTRGFCFSNVLGDGMVLQRDARAAVFGFTAPGDTVACTLTPEGGIAKARLACIGGCLRSSPLFVSQPAAAAAQAQPASPVFSALRCLPCRTAGLQRARGGGGPRGGLGRVDHPPGPPAGVRGPLPCVLHLHPARRAHPHLPRPAVNPRTRAAETRSRPAGTKAQSTEIKPSIARAFPRRGAGKTATLKDVLFGDVFLCGGQSNMALNLRVAFEGEQYIERADKCATDARATTPCGCFSPRSSPPYPTPHAPAQLRRCLQLLIPPPGA